MNCKYCKDTGMLTLFTSIENCTECKAARTAAAPMTISLAELALAKALFGVPTNLGGTYQSYPQAYKTYGSIPMPQNGAPPKKP